MLDLLVGPGIVASFCEQAVGSLIRSWERDGTDLEIMCG